MTQGEDPSPGSPGRTVHFQAECRLTSAGFHALCTAVLRAWIHSAVCPSESTRSKAAASQSWCLFCWHQLAALITVDIPALHLGQLGSRTPTCLWLVWHLGHAAPHGVPFLDGGAPLKVQQQGGGDGDVAPGPTAARQLQARAAGCSLESSPWAPVLLARGTQLMFSNTKWSCLQMPSKSQNSPNLPSFVNRLQPTPMTIAACLCASLQLHGGAALRG